VEGFGAIILFTLVSINIELHFPEYGLGSLIIYFIIFFSFGSSNENFAFFMKYNKGLLMLTCSLGNIFRKHS